jgi:hypothetical protein
MAKIVVFGRSDRGDVYHRKNFQSQQELFGLKLLLQSISVQMACLHLEFCSSEPLTRIGVLIRP